MVATQMNQRNSLFPPPRVMDELRELTMWQVYVRGGTEEKRRVTVSLLRRKLIRGLHRYPDRSPIATDSGSHYALIMGGNPRCLDRKIGAIVLETE